jgi:hypothetical protein
MARMHRTIQRRLGVHRPVPSEVERSARARGSLKQHWTSCGFNAGCVEAAVMSGRLAAHAIAATPPLENIVGFDHP